MAVSIFPVPSNAIDLFAPPGAVEKIYEGAFRGELPVNLGAAGRYAIRSFNTNAFGARLYFINQHQDIGGTLPDSGIFTFETFRPSEQIRLGFSPVLSPSFNPASTTPFNGDETFTQRTFTLSDSTFTTSAVFRTRSGRWLVARSPGSGASTGAIAWSDSANPYSASDWTHTTTPSARYTSFTQLNNGTIIVVGWLGAIATSTDGNTWTARTSNMGTSEINAVATDGTVAVASSYNGSLITYSTDGTTWTAVTVGTGSNTDIIYANGQFILTKNNSTAIFTSPNGVTWTQRTMPWGRGANNARNINFLNGTVYGTTNFGDYNWWTTRNFDTWLQVSNNATNTTRTAPIGFFWGDMSSVSALSTSTLFRVFPTSSDEKNWQITGYNVDTPKSYSHDVGSSSRTQLYFSGSSCVQGNLLNSGSSNSTAVMMPTCMDSGVATVAVYRLA